MTKIIKRRTPFHTNDIRSELLQPFDSLVDRVFNESFPNLSKEFGSNFFQQGSYPKCNVLDYSDKMIIEAAIPGMDKDDVDIQILDQTLTISGNKQKDDKLVNEEGLLNYVHRELKKSAFRRTFNLGKNLQADNISAEFDQGILYVTIPKREPVKVEIEKPKHVKIK